jgi:putative membrane protein
MLSDALLAWLHFALIFALISVLTIEMVTLRYCDRPGTVARLAKVDLAYLFVAGLVLLSGLLRVFLGAKGPAFYAGTWLFHLKLSLFVLVGLISILPTLSFMRWRKAQKSTPGFVPPLAEVARAKRWIHVELTLILLIPLIASLMARGFGRIAG